MKRDSRLQGSHSRGAGKYSSFGKVKQRTRKKKKSAPKVKKVFGKRKFL